MTSLHGAFSNLGKYALNFHGRVNLKASASWNAALKSWDHLAKQHQPVHQTAATAEDIMAAVQLQPDPQIRMFMVLLWLLAARKGDIAHLRPDSVQLRPDGRILVFVQEGKGVRARQGKYHIVSACPPIWHQELKDFLHMAIINNNKFLFRPSLAQSGEILQALRAANPALNCRAVRRGAAQAMAKDKKVDEATIMSITGHKCVKTLHRYLGWDMINEKVHSAAQEAARNNLAPILQQLQLL